jgi:putative membrane protein
MDQLPLAHAGGLALDPLQLAGPLLAAAAYWTRARHLARRGRPVPTWRQACMYAGLALIAATLLSPLAHVADELLAAHMAEHLLIADVAALLIVLGLTGPILQPVLRIRLFDRLRVLAHPVPALVLWALNLYLWHVPLLHEAAVRHDVVHALQHASFIAFGINMWMPVFGPLPQPAWFGNGAKLGYVIAVRLAGAVLGNVFVWAGHGFYDVYTPAEWDISAATDQSLAGAIMMIEGSLLTLGLFAWLFWKSATEGEASQELVEHAQRLGVELAPERAARAVAAGRGDELRGRVERAAAGSEDRAQDQHDRHDDDRDRDDPDQKAERLRL